MRSIVDPARVAPNVPTNTISIAGMLMNAAGEVPSIIEPMRRPKMATPIPMAVAAFMGKRVPLVQSSAHAAIPSSAEAGRRQKAAPGPRASAFCLLPSAFSDGRVPPAPRLVEDLGAPLLHGCGDLF